MCVQMYVRFNYCTIVFENILYICPYKVFKMNKNPDASRFEMRTTNAFKALLNKLAEKKQMKVPELVHYLVRREAEKEKIKTD